MSRISISLVVLICCSTLLSAQGPNRNPNKGEPPILGPHWSREQAKQHAASTSNNCSTMADPSFAAQP